jgi:hypothetical protein
MAKSQAEILQEYANLLKLSNENVCCTFLKKL